MEINFWTFLLCVIALYCIVEIVKNICYAVLLSKYAKYGKDIDKAVEAVDEDIKNMSTDSKIDKIVKEFVEDEEKPKKIRKTKKED